MRKNPKFPARSVFVFMLGILGTLPAAFAFDRVVTLSPLLAEWSAELMGDEKANRVIQGVSEYSDFPAYLKKKPTIGPYPQIQIENVARLKPDLVLASEEYTLPEQIEKLKRLNLHVEIVKKEHFNSMGDWIEELGNILDERASAAKARSQWERVLAALRARKSKRVLRTAFLEIQHQPLISVGGESFLNEAFEFVGLQNVFSTLKEGYPKISKEAVLKANPDEIYILDLNGKGGEFKASKEDWERYSQLRAVLNHKVRVLSGADFARCTPRLLNALKRLN